VKYILFLLLGTASAVWGMEDTAAETRKPLGERQLDVNRFAGIRVSYPTCLNTSAKDGYSLESTLSIRRNCLGGFVQENIAAIKALGTLGLFMGKITSYNEEVMTILHGIFSNDNKENLQRSIPGDFLLYPIDFFRDLDDLKILIRQKDERPEEIKNILEEMYKPFHFVNWMTTYYSNHVDTYKLHHH